MITMKQLNVQPVEPWQTNDVVPKCQIRGFVKENIVRGTRLQQSGSCATNRIGHASESLWVHAEREPKTQHCHGWSYVGRSTLWVKVLKVGMRSNRLTIQRQIGKGRWVRGINPEGGTIGGISYLGENIPANLILDCGSWYCIQISRGSRYCIWISRGSKKERLRRLGLSGSRLWLKVGLSLL